MALFESSRYLHHGFGVGRGIRFGEVKSIALMLILKRSIEKRGSHCLDGSCRKTPVSQPPLIHSWIQAHLIPSYLII